MRISIIVLAIMLFNSALTSQPVILISQVSNDTVTLIQQEAWRNCGAEYTMMVSRDGYHLDWYQIDTGLTALCYCYFDLSVTYGPLDPGFYTSDVYYVDVWAPGDTLYVGTVSFTIAGTGSANREGIIGEYQSPCYIPQGTAEEEKPDTHDPFGVSPIPANGFIRIKAYPVKGEGDIELVLYDCKGSMIWTKTYVGPSPIDEKIGLENNPPGIYLLVYRSTDHFYCKKIPVSGL